MAAVKGNGGQEDILSDSGGNTFEWSALCLKRRRLFSRSSGGRRRETCEGRPSEELEAILSVSEQCSIQTGRLISDDESSRRVSGKWFRFQS